MNIKYDLKIDLNINIENNKFDLEAVFLKKKSLSYGFSNLF